MPLSPDDIQKLCELARLEISPEQTGDLAGKLTDILAMVDQLQAVPTTGVEPMAHPMDRPQRLRQDRVTETDQHARYQQDAPLVERDLYLVPRVIE